MVNEVNLLFNVTIYDISAIYVTAHRCAGGLKKKLNLRSGSQRHRHFAGFFNVPVQTPTRDHPFYTVIPTHRPIKSPFTITLGIRRTHSRLNPPGPHGGNVYGFKTPIVCQTSSSVHIYVPSHMNWNIVAGDVKQPNSTDSLIPPTPGQSFEFEFIGVLRQMQRYFSHTCYGSYTCDGTDVQADWVSCTYGRTPNAIYISQGSNVAIQAPTRDQTFYTVIPTHRPNKSPFTTRWDTEDTFSTLPSGPPRGR